MPPKIKPDLAKSSSSSSAKTATATSTSSPVINLEDDDGIREAKKRSIADIFGGPNKKPKNYSQEEIVILSSDDEKSINLCDDEDDDEIQIMEPSTTASSTVAILDTRASDGNGNDEDEVQAIGEKNVMRLPHMRQHCTKCKFVEDVRSKHLMGWSLAIKRLVEEGKKCNPKHCDLCYCFVCDKPVSECKNWSSATFNAEDHCHASDKGSNAQYYKNKRNAIKRGSTDSSSTSASASGRAGIPDQIAAVLERFESNLEQDMRTFASLHGISLGRTSASTTTRDEGHPNHPRAMGPWPPTNAEAKKMKTLTQCRKCRWFNKFIHHNFTKNIGRDIDGTPNSIRRSHHVGTEDWCRACGRVASSRDFGKEQSVVYKRKLGDVLVGVREIGYGIHSRDPRKLTENIKKRWEENKGDNRWVYNEEEMEYDFYQHRIGKHPRLSHLLHAVPVVHKDMIPESTGMEQGIDCYNSLLPSPAESEALILDEDRDLALLRELYAFDKDGSIAVTLDAVWDRSKRKGTIKISLFLTNFAMVQSATGNSRQSAGHQSFSRLLGCWFNVFPFKLSDLTCGMKAKPLTRLYKDNLKRDHVTGIIPRQLGNDERKDFSSDVDSKEVLERYNKDAETTSKKLSFTSSAGSRDCGVVASSDTTFAGTLKRSVESSLVDDALRKDESYDAGKHLYFTTMASKVGVVSNHRSMRASGFGPSFINNRISGSYGITSYLEQKDVAMIQNLTPHFRKISKRCRTMNGLLQQLENLGHSPAEQVDGLNVELFDFQRQAVGWALERERGEGGIERFLWTRLPTKSSESVGGAKTKEVQLYYSPVLDLFRKDAPADVRGGLIAAQMGLGKTVISLSLVLLNPAPELPISGTAVSSYVPPRGGRVDRNASLWPPIPMLPEGAPEKRGSIFSRGTLVVCNVSLVGQWIDEAKSKLKDPGLVYSYHGGNRKRDPMILAKNGVVVTTYAVLASDANHWAKKSNDPKYCAPCEQIRWWRIVCDESHSIRDSNTLNFRALNRLTAVNKWCVTGTPMNTTPKDLKPQLTFVGVSYLDKMFSLFSNNMEDVFNTKRRRHSYNSSTLIGPFLFLMRNVMIRHAISQVGRVTKRGIMSLPPKEEKVIEIEFNEIERTEYDRIQEKAIGMYQRLKMGGKVSRHYLKLTSALLPLRLACSGGQIDEGQIKKKGSDGGKRTGNELEYDLDAGTECAICLDAIEDPCATTCKPVPHIFCRACIDGLFSGEGTKSCPCCRATVKRSDIRDVVPISKPEQDEEKKDDGDGGDIEKKRAKKKKNQELRASDILFKSKFATLLKELTRIRDEEPGSKSLVFSQFTSTLQWMKQELPKHGFQFRTLSGDMSMKKRADALREFQSDPPTTIFLLSMRSGAAGINLTQANRVFLMEPAMNPALEAQAIGRVYRLGQKKAVQVIKMRMKDSFESRLVKVLKRKFDCASKPDPSGSNGSGKDEGNENSKGGESDEVISVTASLGHMTRDKADLMTEEFDALFGITEPEDLPDTGPTDNGVGTSNANTGSSESDNGSCDGNESNDSLEDCTSRNNYDSDRDECCIS